MLKFRFCPPGRRLRANLILSMLVFGPALASVPQALPEPAASVPVAVEIETLTAILVTETAPDGSLIKAWQPATDIREGQVVYYTVKIRNPGLRAAHNVTVTKPIPLNTRYVADSAAAPGAAISFSIDGGVTFAPARELLLKDDRDILRPAPPERYTHIRWDMRHPLAPGAIAYVRFRTVFR